MKKEKIINYINELLKENNFNRPIGLDDSLFLSGLLDSLNMTCLIVFLETEFNVDFSVVGFDVEEIDTINLISNLAGIQQ